MFLLDSTIPLLSLSETSGLYPSFVVDCCRTGSETLKTGFLMLQSILLNLYFVQEPLNTSG